MTKTYISFTQQDCEILSQEVLYQGVFRLMKYRLRFRLFNGGFSKPLDREVFERRSAVAVLPFDPVQDRVILIEQFRPGALNSGRSPWLLEIIAGIIEPDEPLEGVVVREAKEEANCDVLDLLPICEYFTSPGGSNEYLHIFCGRFDATNAGGIFGLHEEDEDIHTLCMTADEAFQLVAQNKIQTSPAIVSLHWLQLNRERLKGIWQTK